MRTPWLKWGLLGLVTVVFLFFPFLLNEFHRHQAAGPGPGIPPPEDRIPYPWLNTYRPQIQNLLLIAFFYLNYLLLVPRFLARKQARRYLAVAGATVLFFIVLAGWMHDLMDTANGMLRVGWLARLPGLLVSYIIVAGISVGLALYEDWRRSHQEREQLKKAALESELSFLKSQVSPHFLFNTLNNIYSLTVVKSDSAPDAVLKLAGLMRYMLHEANAPLVPVEKELNYLGDYIELQRLRLTEKVKINYEVKGNPGEARIQPLLLIPFVENAFKHGVSYSGESVIHIALECSAADLHLRVLNPVIAGGKEKKDNASGVGLDNVKKRLALLYPDKHRLEISNDGRHFSVALYIQLH